MRLLIHGDAKLFAVEVQQQSTVQHVEFLAATVEPCLVVPYAADRAFNQVRPALAPADTVRVRHAHLPELFGITSCCRRYGHARRRPGTSGTVP